MPCILVHTNVAISRNQWLIIFHVIYLKYSYGRMSTFSQILKCLCSCGHMFLSLPLMLTCRHMHLSVIYDFSCCYFYVSFKTHFKIIHFWYIMLLKNLKRFSLEEPTGLRNYKDKLIDFHSTRTIFPHISVCLYYITTSFYIIYGGKSRLRDFF